MSSRRWKGGFSPRLGLDPGTTSEWPFHPGVTKRNFYLRMRPFSIVADMTLVLVKAKKRSPRLSAAFFVSLAPAD